MDYVIGNTSWDASSEEFANLIEEQFMILNSVQKDGLKSFLQKKRACTSKATQRTSRSVRIKSDTTLYPSVDWYKYLLNKIFGTVLYECAQLQESHEWTDEDLRCY